MSSQDASPTGISIPLKTLVQSSFTTAKIINYRPFSKYRGTPRCLGLSSDGRYLACGDDLGRLEIRETNGVWPVVQMFSAGDKITCIQWHPTFPRTLFFSSKCGNVHIIQLADEENTYQEDLISFDGYITGIAISSTGSQLAVALHNAEKAYAHILLVNRPMAVRVRTIHHIPTEMVVPPNLNGDGQIPMTDIPLSVHFLDSYSVLGVYSTKAFIFCTTFPFDPVGHIPSAEGLSSMVFPSISPDKLELVACNPGVFSIERYSISQKRHVFTHNLMFTDVAPVSRRLFGVDWLDSSTLVAGHNESFVTIITDSKRDGHPDRYRHIYHRLSITRNRVTHTVCAGNIGDNPVIVAVNGEGQEAQLNIIEVNYSRPRQVDGNRGWMARSPSPGLLINLITLLLAFTFFVCTFLMYTEVKKALEICVVAMNSMRGAVVVMP